MTKSPLTRSRWAEMDSEKRADFLYALQQAGVVPAGADPASVPDLPAVRDMMDCLCDCEKSYDDAIEGCKENATDFATCKAGARAALTDCCAGCG